MSQADSILGSACGSRVGERGLALANFFFQSHRKLSSLSQKKFVSASPPKPAREPRALPRSERQNIRCGFPFLFYSQRPPHQMCERSRTERVFLSLAFKLRGGFYLTEMPTINQLIRKGRR